MSYQEITRLCLKRNYVNNSNGFRILWQKGGRMEKLQAVLKDCIENTDVLTKRLHMSEEESAFLHDISKKYPIRVTPYYLNLIDPDDPFDPIRKMCLPDHHEFLPDGQTDTSGESDNTVIQGMQHKYAQTALILSTNQCAMYCRHCFRKRLVGMNSNEIAQKLPEMASYVQDHPEINNILISGGDAFMNTNSLLRRYLETFSSLPNIQYIRFGTRIPVVLPARITEDQELQDLLNEYSRIRQIIVVTQFNHPRELTEEAGEAVRLLRKCGCIVRNQTVLLKGINDEPSVLAALLNGLVGIGVLPYYVFQCRPVRGVKNQFQVPIRDGVKTVDAAKSMMSGQAKGFRYAMSHPKGKIEILAEMPDGSVLFKFHQAKYEKDASRLFTLPLSETQAWLPVNI